MNYNYAEKYIKKPVVVEAFHYRKNYTDYRDLERFCGDALLGLDKDYVVNYIITHRWKKHIKQGITNLYD